MSVFLIVYVPLPVWMSRLFYGYYSFVSVFGCEFRYQRTKYWSNTLVMYFILAPSRFMAVILTVNYLLLWDRIYLYTYIYIYAYINKYMYIYLYLFIYICIYISVCQFKIFVWNVALLRYSPSMMYAIFTFRKIWCKSFFSASLNWIYRGQMYI